MLRNISTAKRIFALILVMVLFIGGVVWGFVDHSQKVESLVVDTTGDVMFDDVKEKLKTATDAVAFALAEDLAGIPDAAAREDHIRRAVDKFRFEEDKSGYFFVYKGRCINVALPVNPKLVGKDLSGAKDPNGVLMGIELYKHARNGGGFVQYVWPKPGKGDQPKLSYARMIPGTEYWIGTGIYVDNIDVRKAEISDSIHGMMSDSLKLILGTVGALFLLLVLPVSIAINRSIVRPIRSATDAARRISEGDLSVSLDAKGSDEAAQLENALNAMAATLQRNIEDITEKTREAEHKAEEAQNATRKAEDAMRRAERAKAEGSHDAAMRLEAIVEHVSKASARITEQSEEIRQGTEIQSQRVGETATAMEEMNATVLEVAHNSSEAASVGQEARDRAVAGSEVVDKSIAAMQTTQRQAEELRDNMALLGQQADAIGNVMNVINDIADQTNLLALNAAIEAARAGEAGRGFAVVADEVRKLAEKTMAATREVGDSISAIQHAAGNNVKSTEAAVEDLVKAVDLANESGEVLREIVDKVEDSAQQIQSIATAAEQQSATSEEINRTVDEINRITAETSKGVNESSEALRELSEQMEELGALIEELKQEGTGV